MLSGKAEAAVKVLQRVARINGRKEEGEKITVEVWWPRGGGGVLVSHPCPHQRVPLRTPHLQILRSHMKEELAGLKASYTISDLVRTPVIRHIFFCLCIVWWGWGRRRREG